MLNIFQIFYENKKEVRFELYGPGIILRAKLEKAKRRGERKCILKISKYYNGDLVEIISKSRVAN